MRTHCEDPPARSQNESQDWYKSQKLRLATWLSKTRRQARAPMLLQDWSGIPLASSAALLRPSMALRSSTLRVVFVSTRFNHSIPMGDLSHLIWLSAIVDHRQERRVQE